MGLVSDEKSNQELSMTYQIGFCILDLWAFLLGILLIAGHLYLTVRQKKQEQRTVANQTNMRSIDENEA